MPDKSRKIQISLARPPRRTQRQQTQLRRRRRAENRPQPARPRCNRARRSLFIPGVPKNHILVAVMRRPLPANLRPLPAQKGDHVRIRRIARRIVALPNRTARLLPLDRSHPLGVVVDRPEIQRRAVARKITGIRRGPRPLALQHRQRNQKRIQRKRRVNMQVAEQNLLVRSPHRLARARLRRLPPGLDRRRARRFDNRPGMVILPQPACPHRIKPQPAKARDHHKPNNNSNDQAHEVPPFIPLPPIIAPPARLANHVAAGIVLDKAEDRAGKGRRC